jgi:hypothetical protein
VTPDRKQPEPETVTPPHDSERDRFARFAKKLVTVPKKEIDEKAREWDSRSDRPRRSPDEKAKKASMKSLAGVTALVVLVGGCTHTPEPKPPEPKPPEPKPWRVEQIRSVVAQPWPEGPLTVTASNKAGPTGAILLSSIIQFIPSPLPSPLPQTCGVGALVTITLSDGQTINYGPCDRPGSIEELRRRMIATWIGRPSPGESS